ncbi:protein-glutamate O-methyltransferase CheR [Geobacter sp. SVR]|uniref:CheR family methyltransferase n=1 Tax=Geobacter sp. SVR TaxID=2495594 RepID=UPI00143F0206|nr:protein-glutamate O-methyltransferase CheR [Geobacter sp. SVR]BCS53850.1 chemotaxis protein methyltransferase [Geobacter sp. SVR]GCF85641.1 chemotaxis protein methyltransferase [Geobacter sp. SVR]
MTLAPCTAQLMSDEEFLLFRDSIYKHCGIYFDEDSKYLLEKRLSRRLTALNIATYREYYQFLKYNRRKDQEMMDIMDILTTNETYFFRESYQLKAFTDEIIPELIKTKSAKGDHTLRIWSAGCSTGEEPYTIAMLIRDISALHGWNIEIIGTDISQRVLQHARRGVYGKTSFRATDDWYLKRFFQQQDDGQRVTDEIRELVTISHLNLFDTHRMMMLGKMDLIFCRNVIIYFDLAAKKKVVESFHKTLFDGGFLLLGHSESLMNISTQFTLRHFKNDMIYQKPERSAPGGLS